jgi:hypothetical protein
MKTAYEDVPYTLLCPALVVLSKSGLCFAIPRVYRMIPILHHLRSNRQTGRLDLLDIALRPDKQSRPVLPHDKRRSPYGRMTWSPYNEKGKQVDPQKHRATKNSEDSVGKTHKGNF